MSDAKKPRKAAHERLVSVRHFRLTESDAKEWAAKVERSGLTESEFFRLAVINNQTVVNGSDAPKKKRATRIKDHVPADVKKAIFLLAQMGNNMNQVAHRVNAAHKAGKIHQDLYMAILEELRAISATIKGWA